MKNRIHFLAGLPRSGSTLLGSILNQNDNLRVSPTSPLYPLMVNTNEQFNILNMQYTFDMATKRDAVFNSILQAFYPDDREQPIAIDKHRGWPGNVRAIRNYIDSNPKIICPVRPIAEIIASYISLAERDENNFIDSELLSLGEEVCNESRANYLWQVTLKPCYESMVDGLRDHPEALLLVEYDSLVFNPRDTLERIYRFCEIPSFEHHFDEIENTCEESKDDAWGLRNLHTIRPTLNKTSVDPLMYLPKNAIDYFRQFDLRCSV